ncbi:putative flavin-containing amine oxidase [Aspergillus eucalypticola CBS 122712]|uniref:monoamine oxidase n=1 Tax=Aspergillus eucalypticola (strain CBS 122712 / IBT 29274) TaxID=1448314 RepID=A0A317V7A7_ASPEC|nr:putative flavin-containing amine oxidase [Aspergillus eucalypticola CBS 122712]PWY69329.1 putative flavin-containing amine oxidase [Aspergillus eucalypticola CBS 122712]
MQKSQEGFTWTAKGDFQGKSVLLVEARDRIGGRCWTAEAGDDTKVELGGTWVHWQQPHVFSELQRYDLANFQETVAFPENGEFVVKESRSHPARVQNSAEGQVMMERLEGLMEKFFDNPDYLELDKLSLADRIAQLDSCSQEERSMLSAHTASFYGVSPEKVSFAEVLHTHALCNFDPAMMDIAIMKYKIARGTTAFARAILDDYKRARIFGSPFVSKFVIPTIPINVISSITFDPPLSTLQREVFSTGVTPAKSDKLLVCTSSDLRNGFNVTCEGGDMPYTSGFADGKHGNHTLLTLLAHPGNNLDRSEENIRLMETLRPTGIQVDSACGHLWSEDSYAGGVTPVRGPEFLQKYHDAIRRPHGQVHLCGSDFADGGRGFISGVFEDAYRVTRDILR